MARHGSIVAPRPLLFVNSDPDRIVPMDANDRVINRLERVYSLYGTSDVVDAVVSIGGHAYRKDIRRAAYRSINLHLKVDPRVVADRVASHKRALFIGRSSSCFWVAPKVNVDKTACGM